MPPTEPGLVAAFYVMGAPVPKQRARKGKGGWYTPEETVNAERQMGWHFRVAARGHRPTPAQCYGVEVLCYVQGARKIDLDNCVKLVLDGLNEVAWLDDNQVTRIVATKVYVTDEREVRTAVRVHLLDQRMPHTGLCPGCGRVKSPKAKHCRACANTARSSIGGTHGG